MPLVSVSFLAKGWYKLYGSKRADGKHCHLSFELNVHSTTHILSAIYLIVVQVKSDHVPQEGHKSKWIGSSNM